MNLFEMLAGAQNGNGIDLIARQFNLSRQQAEQAVGALLPAFSQGLKRNAADPYGVAGFLSALSTGQHAIYFEDASQAFAPQGVEEGNGILGHLFGSKELSRAVASQAAQATGIGQQVLQQMLPVVASMIMGGMFKQSTGQLQAGGFGSNNPLGEIIEQMMRQGGASPGGADPRSESQARPRRQASDAEDPFDNPFGKVLKDMFGGGLPPQVPQREQPAGNPYGDNPFGKIFEEMMRGGQRRQDPVEQEPAQPAPRRRPPADTQPQNPYDDIFGKMFETGARQRDEYQKNVDNIFEQFTKGMDRYR